jgi:hypothetical protein
MRAAADLEEFSQLQAAVPVSVGLTNGPGQLLSCQL